MARNDPDDEARATKPEVRPCHHPEPLEPWMDAAGGLVCSVCHPNPNTPGAAP